MILAPSGGGLILYQAYGNLYVMTGRKAHLLEDKQIPSVGAFDEVYFAFGLHLDDLHMTWAHLEKKRTRLRTNTMILEDLSLQTLETASEAIQDAVAAHQAKASQDFTTASARADSKADLEDSSHDGTLETASKAIQDAVAAHQETASQDFTTASAYADSKADLEDSSHDGVTPIKRCRRCDFPIYTNRI
ncbi:hypothetical protein Tco_0840584 [Tanacetum coccineum]|uniref:Uncharacterized protein n=1 Tax=Tanacetum coccineum TaxID=301880 RepID=A0ABQ5AWH4_9ASTR